RTINCSPPCLRPRTGCGPSTPATSRARPIWRWGGGRRPGRPRTLAWARGGARGSGCAPASGVVPGPGLLNSAAALLTAYSMNAPVLALIGEIPDADIGRHLGSLHEHRAQAGLIKRLVDYSALVRNPEQAPRLVAEAIQSMVSG